MIEDHNAMELKGYIARCRFMVVARTHASIAAYSTQVPTLVVGYSVKARGIAKDIFGTEENYVIPVQSLTKESELTEVTDSKISFQQKKQAASDLRKLKTRAQRLENDIEDCEKQIEDIKAKMLLPENYSSSSKFRQLEQKQASLEQQIEEDMLLWDELQQMIKEAE